MGVSVILLTTFDRSVWWTHQYLSSVVQGFVRLAFVSVVAGSIQTEVEVVDKPAVLLLSDGRQSRDPV